MYDDRVSHSVNSSAIWKCAIMTGGVAADSAAAFASCKPMEDCHNGPPSEKPLEWQQRGAEVCRRDPQRRCRLRHNIRLLRTRRRH